MKYQNLIEVLQEQSCCGTKGITIINGQDKEEYLSYAELKQLATKALFVLQKKGLKPGDELVFQIADYKQFLIYFWAGLMGGIVPVSLSLGRNDDQREKLFQVWQLLNKPTLLINEADLQKLATHATGRFDDAYASMQTNHLLVKNEIETIGGLQDGILHEVQADDTAFIQFSSGSTGVPKGVMLTHANLIANVDAIALGAQYTGQDILLSWMPLTHDMGMIGFHLNPLYSGLDQYLIPTNVFVRRPTLWLDKVSEKRASVIGSPNFGYRYLLKYLKGEQKDWDLSCVRVLYNGAEPISEMLCHEFNEALAAYQLSPTAMCPVYGLAEASVAVSISGVTDTVKSLHLDRNHLNTGDAILTQEEAAEGTATFVNVGRVIEHCALRIADDQAQVVADGVIGHVQIKGANVTQGYYNNAEATAKAMAGGGWVDTGDLGFMIEGALYVTGRAKDILFINGQNFYPHDIEKEAEHLEEIELNKIAIAGHFNPSTQQEEALAFVFHRGGVEGFIPLGQKLKSHINARFGFELSAVIPVNDIPKTTSGKLQRFKLLQRYLNNEYDDTIAEVTALEAALLSEQALEAPATAQEVHIAALWCQVLGLEQVGATQDFFACGGNSLKAAELGMLLQQELEVELSLPQLFEYRSVRQLAAALEGCEQKAYEPIPQVPASPFYALSPTQSRLYYAWKLDPESLAYNIPTAYRLNGPIDTDRLEYCLRYLAEIHSSWRMTFHEIDGPKYKINESLPVVLEHIFCEQDEWQMLLPKLVRPFDLSLEAPCRFTLVYGTDQESVLFADFHHLVSDGQSIKLFIDQLMQLYVGEQPKPAVSYADYTAWVQAQQAQGTFAAQQQYWLDRFADQLPALSFPTDYPRPAVPSMAGARASFTLSTSTSAALRELAASQKVTLHALLLSSYQLFLTKLTGQQDTTVGIPVSGRTHADLLEAQGMFVNNLAIRKQLNGEQLFTDNLQETAALIMEAFAHQEVPFSQWIEQLPAQNDTRRNPVFDTMFNFQNMGTPESGMQGLNLSRYAFDPGLAKYDLSIELFDEPEISCSFEYATDLWSAETIEALTGYYCNLLSAIISNPELPLAEYSLMAAEELVQQVPAQRDGEVEAEFTPVHTLFRQQAIKNPHAIALVEGETSITYQELDEQSEVLAAQLSYHIAQETQLVGVYHPKSISLMVSILGILKAGLAYLPLEPELPTERIKTILQASGCTCVLTSTRDYPKDLASDFVNYITVSDLLQKGRRGKKHPVKTEPEHLAYVIYTSGTTGQPKGVMVNQLGLSNYITWAAEQYLQGDQLSFALHSSISFDLTVTSLFTPLVRGNTLYIYDTDAEGKLPIERVIEDNKANVVKLTPAHLNLLSNHHLLGQNKALRRLVVGGEKLDTSLARKVYEQLGAEVEIINEYGPTEATVGCIVYGFDPAGQSVTVPIGTPIANARAYLLDLDGKPVPNHVVGELYIAGECLASGYLHQPELSAASFVLNPFEPGTRMYKTGDLAVRDARGLLEFKGRSDEQIKINGYRVEPGEIENCLTARQEVDQAVVLLSTASQGKPALIAYYVADQLIDEQQLRLHLVKNLPHYMIPARLVQVDSIPLTSNGKVDTAALATMARQEAKTQEAPVSETEQLMMQVWSEVLAEEVKETNANFYELGGDSIKAVQITAKLQEKGIIIKARDIMTYHTLDQICLVATPATEAAACDQGLQEGELSSFPIHDWFFAQEFKNPNHYHQTVVLELQQTVLPSQLQAALQQLVLHHDGLRLNATGNQHQLHYNAVHTQTEFALQLHQLDANATEADLEQIQKILSAHLHIESSLLIGAALVTQEGVADRLVLSAHHLLVDGISWRILFDHLALLLGQQQKGEEMRLPAKTASLKDWANALQTNQVLEASEIAYWDEVESTDFALPQDHPTRDWSAKNKATLEISLSQKETAFLLKEAYHTYHTDPLMLMTTALSKTLMDWAGTNQAVIEFENHGRHHDEVDTSGTVGWFTCMYPVRFALPKLDLATQIQMVKEQLRAVPQQGMGYGLYQQKAKVSMGRPAPAEVRFNYLGQFDQDLDASWFKLNHEATGLQTDAANHLTAKLEINALILEGMLRVEFSYNALAHEQSTIHHLGSQFKAALEQILLHIRSEEEVHFSPSDFESTSLTQDDLNVLFD